MYIIAKLQTFCDIPKSKFVASSLKFLVYAGDENACGAEKNAAVMLKDIYGFGLFFVVLGRGHVLGHKNGEIFWRRMSLWDRVLVKMCKFF